MKIIDLINKALFAIKLEWKQDTYKHYKLHLEHFLRWSNTNGLILVSDVTENQIIDYIAYMKLTCSNRTLNIRIGNLKRAYRYAKVNTNIFDNIPHFTEARKTFEMVTVSELKRIREYAFNLKDDYYNNLTQKAIIILLIDTGVRRRELCFIEKKNVNLEERTIKLTSTKTSDDRIVHFKKRTSDIVKKLLETKTNHKYLIHNYYKNRAINVDDVTYTFKKVKRELKTDVHPHMIRHSFASIMLENDAQLKVVMDLMGHKNIETTERYTHVSKKRIKNTYNETYNLDEED
ncbi:MAG: tyrosine-type recombinase/integrase [Acholeplasma sp.]|nr:tyrosine-type recombinase/integrase [Acholeplasma sp.]